MTYPAERGNRQVLAIGLEATEPSLIERWTREGHLPTFRALMRRGVWRRLLSDTEISSGATWASLNTGTNPGKHGMGFYHRQLRCGTYQLRKKYANEIGRESFWVQLSDAGKRVAVLDVPDTFVLEDLNGVQLVGWGGEGLNAPHSSWPQPLFRQLTARFGRHPLDRWYQARPKTSEGWLSLRDKLLAGTRTRTAIAHDVHRQEPWDLFLVGFAEPHWVGHFFWHLMDPRHPDYDERLARSCGDAILRLYQELDRAVAMLIQGAPQATVLVFSNTGMGPNFSGLHLVPDILQRLGMAPQPSHGTSRLLPAQRWGPYAIKRIAGTVTPKAIERMKKVLPERLWDSWTRWVLGLGNIWPHSLAFTVPSDYSGALRINLKGREPNGLVEPGEPYQALCDELEAAFLGLVNPATGKPAVREVVKVRERYHGDHLDELPDLLVRWTNEAPITSLASPRIGTVSGVLPDERTGAHLPYGFLLAAGDGIRADRELEAANIMDIAPTILHLLGKRPSPDTDGHVLEDVFDEPVGEPATRIAT